MSLRENMAAFLRSFAEKNDLSIAQLQIQADISRNTLYAYSKGQGNPTLATLEYIAENLKVDPAAILLGVYDPDGGEVSVLLLHTVRGLAELRPEDRRRFMRLFLLEMARLWSGE